MTVNRATMEKLRALKAVADAESATAGERANARKLLGRLLRKYGVTEADIKTRDTRLFPFTVKGEHQITLLCHVMAYVQQSGGTSIPFRRHRGKIWLEVTEEEAVEINRLMLYHGPALEKELDLTARGYIQRNKLYGPGTSDRELSAEEMREVAAILRRANLMKKTKVIESRKTKLIGAPR